MNMNQNNICNWIDIGFDSYQCINCGIIVHSTDGPPVFPCSYIEPKDLQELQNIGLGCSTEEINKRYNICSNCEFFNNNTCSKCGCRISAGIDFKNKLIWRDQECPIQKWSKER